MVAWNSSYVLACNNASDGGTYFFSYFNEFEERSHFVKILEVGILAIIFIISLISNVAIALCVIRYPDMKTVTNSFVLNLAAADIVFAFTMPAVGYSRLTTSWVLGNLTCKFIPYIQFVSASVLLWTLTLISNDRYRCVVVPPYRSNLTTLRAHIYCVITWFVAATSFIPVLIWFQQHPTVQHSKYVCTIIFPKSDSPISLSILCTIPVLISTCILPIIILVYNYVRIFQKIISTKDTWASSCVTVSENLNTNPTVKDDSKPHGRRQSEVSLSEIFSPWSRKTSSSHLTSSNGRHGSLSQHEEMRLKKHIKLVRVLFLNVIMALVMWTPITIVLVLIFFDGNRAKEDNNYFLRSFHFIIALMFAFLNTVINPLIYGVLSEKFRACLLKMCCSRFVQEDDIIENTVTLSSRQNNQSYRSRRKPSYVNSVSDM